MSPKTTSYLYALERGRESRAIVCGPFHSEADKARAVLVFPRLSIFAGCPASIIGFAHQVRVVDADYAREFGLLELYELGRKNMALYGDDGLRAQFARLEGEMRHYELLPPLGPRPFALDNFPSIPPDDNDNPQERRAA